VLGLFGRYVKLDHDTLVSLLDYDQVTGIFRWRVNRYRVTKGDVAGSISPTGHRQIGIFQHNYLAQQLAWFYVTGKFPNFATDHRNGNRDDNSWRNLRRANHSQNGANRRKNKNSTSGFKGVTRLPSGRWRAQITQDRKNQHVGVFDSAAEAHAAYFKAAQFLFGEFARPS
jgi:hypothetical protein